MATTHTWYYSEGQGWTSIYDPESEANTVPLLQDENAKSAWWVDSEGNKFLVWKKPQEQEPEYLYYGGMTAHEINNFVPE